MESDQKNLVDRTRKKSHDDIASSFVFSTYIHKNQIVWSETDLNIFCR